MFAERILSCSIIVLALLTSLAFVVNDCFFQYPGNIYIPSGALLAGLNLLFMYAGLVLLSGRDGKIAQIFKELIYFFLIMALLGLATTAVQYTPFPVVDRHILALESFFRVDTRALIAWAHAKPGLVTVLDCIYASLDYQMCYIPLVIIAARRTDLIREYYFLLIITALTGFTFYYFFPTTAPASVFGGEYFSEAQWATSLKFFQIHHHIQPQTMEGGLIAMPSFHVIWAWLCLYLLRTWPMAVRIFLPVNLLLTASCVLLGWHYVLDIVGSVVVICIAHGLYFLACKNRSSMRHSVTGELSLFGQPQSRHHAETVSSTDNMRLE